MEAEGKVALVVGASKGVGLAVRRLLSALRKASPRAALSLEFNPNV